MNPKIYDNIMSNDNNEDQNNINKILKDLNITRYYLSKRSIDYNRSY